MSSEAIAARLDELNQLFMLAVSLQEARLIGPLEAPIESSPGDSDDD